MPPASHFPSLANRPAFFSISFPGGGRRFLFFRENTGRAQFPRAGGRAVGLQGPLFNHFPTGFNGFGGFHFWFLSPKLHEGKRGGVFPRLVGGDFFSPFRGEVCPSGRIGFHWGMRPFPPGPATNHSHGSAKKKKTTPWLLVLFVCLPQGKGRGAEQHGAACLPGFFFFLTMEPHFQPLVASKTRFTHLVVVTGSPFLVCPWGFPNPRPQKGAAGRKKKLFFFFPPPFLAPLPSPIQVKRRVSFPQTNRGEAKEKDTARQSPPPPLPLPPGWQGGPHKGKMAPPTDPPPFPPAPMFGDLCGPGNRSMTGFSIFRNANLPLLIRGGVGGRCMGPSDKASALPARPRERVLSLFPVCPPPSGRGQGGGGERIFP